MQSDYMLLTEAPIKVVELIRTIFSNPPADLKGLSLEIRGISEDELKLYSYLYSSSSLLGFPKLNIVKSTIREEKLEGHFPHYELRDSIRRADRTFRNMAEAISKLGFHAHSYVGRTIFDSLNETAYREEQLFIRH